MAIYRPTYCSREDVQLALDISPTQIDYARIDRAVMSASEEIDGICHRRFYTVYETHYWDWPNYQYSYPWRIWLDQAELAAVDGLYVPVVTTGGSVIPADQIFWRPWNYGPPYYAVELNRSTSAAFGVSATPQRDVAITGWFGYWVNTLNAGTLAVTMSDTTSTTLVCSDANLVGVGDVLIVDAEWMLVQDRGWYDSTETVSSGATTASAADNTVTPSAGTFYAGEVLLLDSEQVLILSVNPSGSYVVKRAFNGTVLATHSAAEIYVQRSLTVTRGDYGSSAAMHSSAADLSVMDVPHAVNALAVAEAVNTVLQETTGYAKVVGEPGASSLRPAGRYS